MRFALQQPWSMLRIRSRAYRNVMAWQLIATVFATIGFWFLLGVSAAVSVLLGGLVGLVAGLGFVLMAQTSNGATDAGTTLRVALRAESVKVGLSVLLLWLVFATYKDVVAVAFVGSFSLAILIFSLAIFVRDA